ncbi:hypothetical protein [Mycobacterium sp. E3198]|uniref:hypothetical protein n=1 Tax=Mycobacterium sp. E3198 TaxID=1834143 RepID=UPI0008019C8A|nr:hypothetical protein [Mycobacterium sp. E3198]OBG25438.1 hypothetical protein A5673_09135 [Mycobacterium sp. E3198]
MPEEPRYTREQQEDTLAALSVIREAQAGGENFAAEDAVREIQEIAARRFSGEPIEDVLARLVAGFTNAAGMLLDWIEAEAAHRRELVERIEQTYPSFEIGYTPDPSWATWSGVLRAIEETVRETPLCD